MPPAGAHVAFFLPMPSSWAKWLQAKMNLQPHENEKADIDNLLKGFLDALYNRDGHVWNAIPSKFWARDGRIIIARDSAPLPRGADYWNSSE